MGQCLWVVVLAQLVHSSGEPGFVEGHTHEKQNAKVFVDPWSRWRRGALAPAPCSSPLTPSYPPVRLLPHTLFHLVRSMWREKAARELCNGFPWAPCEWPRQYGLGLWCFSFVCYSLLCLLLNPCPCPHHISKGRKHKTGGEGELRATCHPKGPETRELPASHTAPQSPHPSHCRYNEVIPLA